MSLRLLLALLISTSVASAAEVIVTVTDADIKPGQQVTWTKDKTYVLSGFVFVDSTASLTIEAGTVIKGTPGEGANASALVVARGGKIYANGTKDEPIIFTAQADDVHDPFDFTKEDRGLWGGLIILGNARINVAGGIENIEGIPVTEPRGMYGGTNDEDNSGVLRYVSVRHGGSNIGANNEINGVTFGAVGSGTVVEYVEVVANADDGFEWFGGTVNCKYLISAFNGDDGFDWDEGFRGKGQFWFVIQDGAEGNSAFECDGGTTPEDGTPYAIPVLSNITAIGSGVDGINAGNTPLVNIRDNSGGKFHNSIFMDGRGYGIAVEDLSSGEDSRSRLEKGDLVFRNNIWHRFKDGVSDPAKYQFLLDTLTKPSNMNQTVDPMLTAISRTDDASLDPRPLPGSPALSNVLAMNDPFFTPTTFRGAFGVGAGSNWLEGWTYLWQGELVTSVADVTPTTSSFNLFPNPASSHATISFHAEAPSPASIIIMNMLGEHVHTVATDVVGGLNSVTLDVSRLDAGSYIVVVSERGGSSTTPFRIVR
jgi:hypothetical protein